MKTVNLGYMPAVVSYSNKLFVAIAVRILKKTVLNNQKCYEKKTV